MDNWSWACPAVFLSSIKKLQSDENGFVRSLIILRWTCERLQCQRSNWPAAFVCFQNSATAKPFHLQDLIINRDAETGADQLPTLIDKKVRDNWSLPHMIKILLMGFLSLLYIAAAAWSCHQFLFCPWYLNSYCSVLFSARTVEKQRLGSSILACFSFHFIVRFDSHKTWNCVQDNVFVISNPREGSMVLQQDVRYILLQGAYVLLSVPEIHIIVFECANSLYMGSDWKLPEEEELKRFGRN